MKSVNYLLITILTLVVGSCSEKEILEEIPQDFLTSGNAFNSPSDIETAINELYYGTREFRHPNVSDELCMDLWLGTDLGWGARDFKGDALSNHDVFNSSNRYPLRRWGPTYKIITNANTIISRIENVTYADASQRSENIAQARFFRAWAYRYLAILFGDVPIVLEEADGPKRDYTRAPRADVFQQCKEDLEFAIANLKDLGTVPDGRVTKQAAYHLMAEIALCLGDHQGAVNAATQVIDFPNMALMTSRFGSDMAKPGNPYWDLFRLNNQNRSSGNRETIWAFQVEFNKGPGSWGDPAGLAARWERNWGPLYNLALGADGNSLFRGPTTYNGGRSQGFFRLSGHMLYGVWGSDYSTDIRNSEYIIKRKWWIDNPSSAFFNDTIDYNKPYTSWQQYLRGPSALEEDTNLYVYPFPLKFSLTNNHFSAELLNGGPGLVGSAGRTYMDLYEMRLAETYLFRAEGYLGLGNTTAAAADINVVRARANASPADPSEIDIDYILDERLRELYCEEPRRLTLGRLGLIYDRAKRYNTYAMSTIQPFHNLWPVPFNEIERNVLAPMPQNPGY